MPQVQFPFPGRDPTPPYRPDADPAGLLTSLLGLRSGPETAASGIALSEAAPCAALCAEPLMDGFSQRVDVRFKGVR